MPCPTCGACTCPPPAPTPPAHNVNNETGPVAVPETVWQALATRRLHQRAGQVVNIGPWLRKVRQNARRDHQDDAVRYLTRHPDLTPLEVARLIDGDLEPLRWRRAPCCDEPSPPVVRLPAVDLGDIVD